jgi:hypothetical protein
MTEKYLILNAIIATLLDVINTEPFQYYLPISTYFSQNNFNIGYRFFVTSFIVSLCSIYSCFCGITS